MDNNTKDKIKEMLASKNWKLVDASPSLSSHQIADIIEYLDIVLRLGVTPSHKVSFDMVNNFNNMMLGCEDTFDYINDAGEYDSFTISSEMNMSEKEAFSVIYFLQDLELIPSTYELCSICSTLYDSSESRCAMSITDFEWTKFVSYYGIKNIDIEIIKQVLIENDGRMFCGVQCYDDFFESSIKASKNVG